MCRLQIVVYTRLVAEVVGKFKYVDQVWGDWCIARWKAGQPMGGAAFSGLGRRFWPVPIGACVYCGALEACEHGEGA